VHASLVVSIPPVFASNPRAGVEEMLDSMLMRYIPAFEGVVLAHSDLHFLDKAATIKADCPFSVCRVGFDATVWSPHIGMKLVGKVNLCSPDHIALLVHRTFNVSIPRHHIPTDHWEFEYGAAVNDPEFGPDAETTGDAQESEEGGKWIHSITSEKLGGPDGFLEFTVIGFTIANEMLSLRGSIQPDPFSPEHVPRPLGKATSEPASESSTAVVRNSVMQFEEEEEGDREGEEDEDDSEVDTFERLGRMGDEAAALEAKRRAEEMQEVQVVKEKKKKRKRKDSDEVVEGKIKSKSKGEKHKRTKT